MNDKVLNSISLTGICASLCESIGVEKPSEAAEPINAITDLVKMRCGTVDRIFMYNPDAVAMWLFQKYTDIFLPVMENSSLALPLRVVMPSVTPVCFGTMYTGALPCVHGITSYTKPVIRIDTIFDALIRAGKKPAIVSTENDSLSMIFLERNMDYFIYKTVDECTEKALKLIVEDNYDFILLYNADYDSTMHRYAPEGAESLSVLEKNANVYKMISDTIKSHWQNHDVLLGFAPDHGCHEIDGGCGAHGLDMAEDLNVMHFYDVIPAKHQI